MAKKKPASRSVLSVAVSLEVDQLLTGVAEHLDLPKTYLAGAFVKACTEAVGKLIKEGQSVPWPLHVTFGKGEK